MQRRLSDYLYITLKGIAMGAADAVPGVSGGTIAFISGIYEELITTISNINLSLWSTFRKSGFSAFWKQLNGNFIVALGLGIIVSFLLLMRLVKFLIEQHPVLIWSFFFGLILASIFFVGKLIQNWNIGTFIALALGTIAAYYVTSLPAMANNDSSLFLFFAGAIAICAMILPGISGSFILVVLGAYKALSDALHDFDFKRIFIFVSGALIGILSFSHVLKWLFKHYKNATLAVLTGFIFGSLNKIWPWKETLTVLDKATGQARPISEFTTFGTIEVYQREINDFESLKMVTEKSVSPFRYSEINNLIDPQFLAALALMVAGFLVIFILEKLGSKTS